MTINLRQPLAVAAAFVPAMILAACQTELAHEKPVLTLEEAKQVTATFETQNFVPPPRTIDELKALIGELPKLPDADTCAERQAGRAEELAAATERVKRASSKSARDSAAAALVVASAPEFVRGNFRATIRMIRRAINALPERGNKVRKAVFHAQLASIYGSIGDRSAARSQSGRAQSLWDHIRRKDPSRYYYSYDGTRKRKLYGAVAGAAVAQAGGQLDIAEAKFRLAIELAPPSRGSSFTYVDVLRLRTELAANLYQQGRLAEAEQVVRETLAPRLQYIYLTKYGDSKFSSGTAMPMTQLAEILNERGRLTDAEFLTRVAIHMHQSDCALPDSLAYVRSRQVLASILASKGDWTGVIDQIEAVRAALEDDPETFERLFGDNIDWAMALIHEGRPEEGIGLMERALTRTSAKEGAEAYETSEVRGLLAMARALGGNLRGAVEDYRQALPGLIAGRDQLAATTGQNVHNARARLIIDAYMSLLVRISGGALERELGLDIAEELFQIASVAQNGSVQRALAAAAVRSSPDDPLLADLLRREQDAAQETNAALNTLAALEFAPPSQVDGDLIGKLRARVLELRAARQTLVSEIRAEFPEFSQLMTPKPSSLAEARAQLRPGEVLVSTYVGKAHTLVWAVPKEGRPVFAVSMIPRKELDRKVAVLRKALDPNAQTLGDIPEFDVATASDLYQAILAPVEAGWRDAKSLLVVAHGSLGYLPFALLPTRRATMGEDEAPMFSRYREVPWLARSHAVMVLPSIASLRSLRTLPDGGSNRKVFVGFGDPIFKIDPTAPAAVPPGEDLVSRGLIKTRGFRISLRAAPGTSGLASADLSQLARLPETADEIRSIALALDADLTRDVFLGRDASEDNVKSLVLSGYRILAFATHGLVPGDLNGLTQPALALSSPEVTEGAEDGLLTMSEILGLKLDADWVVLSACNTASGDGAGAEAISGLGRAFFYAGARALLVSNWPVETTSAKTLTTDIFRRQAADPGLSRTQALRGAMLGLMDGPGYVDGDGRTVFSYAHPIFWAPFTLIGDGGGAAPGA